MQAGIQRIDKSLEGDVVHTNHSRRDAMQSPVYRNGQAAQVVPGRCEPQQSANQGLQITKLRLLRGEHGLQLVHDFLQLVRRDGHSPGGHRDGHTQKKQEYNHQRRPKWRRSFILIVHVL